MPTMKQSFLRTDGTVTIILGATLAFADDSGAAP